jgi:hypothetical protein
MRFADTTIAVRDGSEKFETRRRNGDGVNVVFTVQPVDIAQGTIFCFGLCLPHPWPVVGSNASLSCLIWRQVEAGQLILWAGGMDVKGKLAQQVDLEPAAMQR